MYTFLTAAQDSGAAETTSTPHTASSIIAATALVRSLVAMLLAVLDNSLTRPQHLRGFPQPELISPNSQNFLRYYTSHFHFRPCDQHKLYFLPHRTQDTTGGLALPAVRRLCAACCTELTPIFFFKFANNILCRIKRCNSMQSYTIFLLFTISLSIITTTIDL